MAWYDFLTGTPQRNEQIQRFNPQQQAGMNQALQQSLSGLQGPLGSGFQPIAQQARSNFSQQTIPGLAERFTSMGSGSLSSPAFASQLGQAGAGLEEGLAAQQAGFGLQERQFLQNLLGLGLTPQFDTVQHSAKPGMFQQIAGPALQALLAYSTGGASAALGAGAGGLAQQAFGGGNQGSSNFIGGGNQNSGYGQGFTNPNLYSPGMQNLLRQF